MIEDILAAYDWFDHPEGLKYVQTYGDAYRNCGHWLFLPGIISAFHKVKLVFLAAAFFSFVLSVTLWFFVDREMGLFVGLWVPSMLGLGVLVLVGEDDSP